MTRTNDTKVAAIYARYSSDRQREDSIEIQVRECSAFIERHGWQMGEVYADYAISGTSTQGRSGFARCIADGEARRYDVLVYLKTDRFARSVADSRTYKQRLSAAGVELWSVREGQQTDAPESFLMSSMTEMFAEYYSRELSVKIKGGIDQNARKCRASGVRIFGYDVDADDHFVINDGEAALVRKAFDMYLQGHASGDIARELNSHGALTRWGNPWSAQSVLKMLRREAYTGRYSYAGHVVEDGMPQIVDRSTYDMAQARRASRSRGRSWKKMGDYVLTGKLRCLECGTPMVGQSAHGRHGKRYEYYCCVSKRAGCGCGLRLRADELDAEVLDFVVPLLKRPDKLSTIAHQVGRVSVLKSQGMLSEADERLSEAMRAHKRLVDAIKRGVAAESLSDEIEASWEQVKALREARQRIIDEAELAKDAYDFASVRRFVERALENPQLFEGFDRAAINQFVDSVWVDSRQTVVVMRLEGIEQEPLSVDEVREIINTDTQKRTNTLINQGVRMVNRWWIKGFLRRTAPDVPARPLLAFVKAVEPVTA